MIIDCIADLHGEYPKLEGGDLLIVSGDLTTKDCFMGWQQFSTWLSAQKYRKKIFIAGNHDNYLYYGRLMKIPLVGPQDLTGVEFLCDSGTEFEGLKIWGSPWTKTFKGMNPLCKAFTVDTEEELAEKFALIPDDIDILITHSPPFGILDGIEIEDGSLFHVGSKALRENVIARIKPMYHIFGHIHEWGGKRVDCVMTRFINASIMNEDYEAVNKPIRVIL